MAQVFTIRKDSTLPILRLELINDNRHDFDNNIFVDFSNAKIFFSMKNVENDIMKISNGEAKCIVSDCCTNYKKIFIEYQFTKKQTSERGTFLAYFDIIFPDSDDNLRVPIREDLIINIS